jgi:hypothetical protein
MFGTAVGAGEQGIFSGQRKGTDASLDDVVVDLDAAVVEEQAQSLPARERVADRRGELRLLADELELAAQPGFEVFDQRPAALLADRTPLLGGTATRNARIRKLDSKIQVAACCTIWAAEPVFNVSEARSNASSLAQFVRRFEGAISLGCPGDETAIVGNNIDGEITQCRYPCWCAHASASRSTWHEPNRGR